MYHKGTRESIDCMDDIVLIQASDVENDNAIQYIKVNHIWIEFLLNELCFFCIQATCIIKHFIEYRYDEEKDAFYDVTQQPTNPLLLLKKSLKIILKETADNMR
jgi:hypothetical protein